MRDTFVKTLIEEASKNRDIILITGDLGFGVLKGYWDRFPDQFINAGIAEQAMTGLAAGLSLEGKTVFTYSIANFPTLRCLEQIRNDVAYHNANVKIVAVGGGFAYGSLGMSHHATEDIAILRALPNVVLLSPGDPYETAAVVRTSIFHQGPVYLRLGRGGERNVHNSPIDNYQIGKAIEIHHGNDAYIFASGAILSEAQKAVDELKKVGISVGLASFPSIKPIDKKYVLDIANEVSLIFTVEEHNVIGGFGSAISEILSEKKGMKAQLIRMGLDDKYSSIVGDQSYLREYYNLSSHKLAKRVCAVISEGMVINNV